MGYRGYSAGVGFAGLVGALALAVGAIALQAYVLMLAVGSLSTMDGAVSRVPALGFFASVLVIITSNVLFKSTLSGLKKED